MPKSKARFLLKAVLSVILNGILFDGVKNLFPALYKGEILRGVYPERSRRAQNDEASGRTTRL